MYLSALLLSTTLVATPPISTEDKPATRAEDTVRVTACQTLAHVQGLRFQLRSALDGDASAFDAAEGIVVELVKVTPSAIDARPLVNRANSFLERRNAVLEFHRGRERIIANTPPLLAALEAATLEELVARPSAARVAALNQLAMLTQRMPRTAGTLMVIDRLDPDSWFMLGKDAKSFGTLLTGLREGNTELRLRPATGKSIQTTLKTTADSFATTSMQVESTLGGLRKLVEAVEHYAFTQSLANRNSQILSTICFQR